MVYLKTTKTKDSPFLYGSTLSTFAFTNREDDALD